MAKVTKVKSTRTRKVKEPVVEPVVSTPEVILTPVESEAKIKFRELIERYKAQAPDKYALKEKELLTKLNTL